MTFWAISFLSFYSAPCTSGRFCDLSSRTLECESLRRNPLMCLVPSPAYTWSRGSANPQASFSRGAGKLALGGGRIPVLSPPCICQCKQTVQGPTSGIKRHRFYPYWNIIILHKTLRVQGLTHSPFQRWYTPPWQRVCKSGLGLS